MHLDSFIIRFSLQNTKRGKSLKILQDKSLINNVTTLYVLDVLLFMFLARCILVARERIFKKIQRLRFVTPELNHPDGTLGALALETGTLGDLAFWGARGDLDFLGALVFLGAFVFLVLGASVFLVLGASVFLVLGAFVFLVLGASVFLVLGSIGFLVFTLFSFKVRTGSSRTRPFVR
jgi:hypothetical protein